MEVRKILNCDIPLVLEYIKKEREMNLFLEGDIEQYGLEGPIVELFAFSEPWDCILLRYFQNYVIYSSNEDYKAADVAAFLKDKKVQVISGKESLLKMISPYYPSLKIQGTYLCRCESGTKRETVYGNREIRKLDSNDAESLAALYKTIKEFSKPYIEHEAEKIQELKESLGLASLAFGLFEGPLLVSAGYATAKTKSGAMIVGVATREGYRQKGYATQVVDALCSESFDSGLSFLCLFYDNPKAGEIYRKIGFKEIGRWGMLKF
ncbi:putative acyltransferase [Sphaerochaeta pleomorpha str. Grapes]|uniref:Putative acyltransferase n=1 Tax=Sphaerochaeta pleomorpha (strain ATCC BAA-1885 / DSM 22778 / Grapes) TaxID=158190 RepID=G8QV45_SPHPG|nr:GNAT family N-acetyltransferase [Sphaerochaeta pleomorpha]AEV29281.1 putative acyltransferase [Sphaerochaeta pleomorpha str. Grapes]